MKTPLGSRRCLQRLDCALQDHGGGVGIGFSQHAGQVIVADGTAAAAKRLSRVLTNDPMMGVFRHADAGYDEARDCATRLDVDIPARDW